MTSLAGDITSAIVSGASSRTSDAFVPSSTPTSAPASSTPAPSSAAVSSASPTPSSAAPSTTVIETPSPIVSTEVVSGTPTPITTNVVTSVQTIVPSSANAAPSTNVVVITRTSGNTPTVAPRTSATRASSAAASSSAAAGLQADNSSNGSSGLGQKGTVAIAVVVPIVVVALLVIAGIFFWRRRKRSKSAKEQRRKEVEEYGYNPNDDPTLPAVVGAGSDSPEMSEEMGYRGWGNNTNGTMSARKPSTNLSSNGIGVAMSDEGQPQGRCLSPSSPGARPAALASDPLMDGTNAAGIGAGAAAGAGGAYAAQRAIRGAGGIERGPSNASSTYSAADRTDDSGEVTTGAQDYTYDSNYSQYTPYNPGVGAYGDTAQQPVIRDVNARRNTRIENAVYPQPGNSGIAQNF